MGCGTSTAVRVADQKQIKNKQTKKGPPTPGSKSISFVVDLDVDDVSKKGNLFKSKLPKRLRRLQEEQEKNILTTEEIVERQKLAEKRRKSAIEERVLKSRKFQAKVIGANRSENSSTKSLNESIDSGKGSQASTATLKIQNKKNSKGK